MLHNLLATMQKRFVSEGGIKERMHQARTGYRQQQDSRLAELERAGQAAIWISVQSILRLDIWCRITCRMGRMGRMGRRFFESSCVRVREL